jgi:hypothetical protein
MNETTTPSPASSAVPTPVKEQEVVITQKEMENINNEITKIEDATKAVIKEEAKKELSQEARIKELEALMTSQEKKWQEEKENLKKEYADKETQKVEEAKKKELENVVERKGIATPPQSPFAQNPQLEPIIKSPDDYLKSFDEEKLREDFLKFSDRKASQ